MQCVIKTNSAGDEYRFSCHGNEYVFVAAGSSYEVRHGYDSAPGSGIVLCEFVVSLGLGIRKGMAYALEAKHLGHQTVYDMGDFRISFDNSGGFCIASGGRVFHFREPLVRQFLTWLFEHLPRRTPEEELYLFLAGRVWPELRPELRDELTVRLGRFLQKFTVVLPDGDVKHVLAADAPAALRNHTGVAVFTGWVEKAL